MRLPVVVLALVVALGGVARAGDESQRGLPRRAIGVELGMHAFDDGHAEGGGIGAAVELAAGTGGRWQVFTEVEAGWAPLRVGDVGHTAAIGVRLDGGVRALMRTWHKDEVAFDLVVEAIAGVGAIAWHGDGLVRPEVGGGVGWHVRMLDTRFTIRIAMRMVLSPVVAVDAAAMKPGEFRDGSSLGFHGVFGVSW